MKKSLVLVLVLILALPFSVVAAKGDSCLHKNTYEVISGWDYVEWSATTHQVVYEVNVECDDCGAWIDWYADGFFQPHDMYNNECIYCDYALSSLPSSEALQREAFQRITEDPEDIIGKTALVIHNGNIRAEASVFSADLGAVIANDELKILNYVLDGNDVWLEIKHGVGIAWISAGLVRISGANALDNEYADFYVGRTCSIKVSSGRARFAPDKNSPVVEYVSYAERYTILACETSTDDTLWFKIMKDGNLCWISSGIATTN